MRSIHLKLATASVATLMAACQPQTKSEPETAIAARAALVTGTDTDAVRYTLQPVDCTTGADDGYAMEIDRPIEDQVIPGGLEDLENAPLDEGSAHQFADLFKVLPPGCYNVHTQPITTGGLPSEVCAPAFKNNVEVLEGETTEVLLINQCAGEDPSAIDVIAAFNNEPEVLDGEFSDSKFVCGSPTQFCAEARDVEGDPIELELLVLNDLDCSVTPEAPVGDDPASGIEQCFIIDCSEVGRVDLGLRVYDLVWDDGDLIRVEEWLADEGYPNESHGELDLFAYFDGGTYYRDVDGDGFGDASTDPVLACTRPTGYTDDATDCDDLNPATYPGAEELACEDGVDNDCDGMDDVCPCSPPGALDLVLLNDLSGSFGDDISMVRGLVGDLHTGVNDCTTSAAFGVASFVDKPFAPFGSSGDYSYAFHQGLSASLSTLQNTVNSLTLRFGGDTAESQLTGLMHTALDASFTWAPGSRRVIVLMTDAVNHVAGHCGPATCTAGPNNGDNLMSELEDYPNLPQVAAALQAIDAEVVFAVTAPNIAHYEGVLASLGVPGDVIQLSSNSANLVDVVLEGIDCVCE